jgi:tRNA-specific 2-thiouridylase
MAEGPVLDLAGREVGRHDGLPRYTVGQRRGLSIPFGERRYVVRLDPGKNAVVVGGAADLATSAIRVGDVRWAAPIAPEAGASIRASVQIRYRHPARAATLRVSSGGGAVDVLFDDGESGVSPGQAAVFFEGDEVLGGGWIGS